MISYSKISKPGSRQINEDYAVGAKIDNRYLFVLCDGLGGHGSGDLASKTAAGAFVEVFKDFSGDLNLFYQKAYEFAGTNLELQQQSDDSAAMMKTTLVSLIIDGSRAGWSHIGDSRLYCFKEGSLVSRTADHSVPQMLYKSGEIEESEIRFHPDRNKLLRALGDPDKEPQYTVSDFQSIEGNFAFLLCSDGFWEYITEDIMETSLRESSGAEDWLEKMTAVVENNNSGKKADNYSAIAVIINEE